MWTDPSNQRTARHRSFDRGITKLGAAAADISEASRAKLGTTTLTTQLSIGNLDRLLRERIIGYQQFDKQLEFTELQQSGFAGRRLTAD